MVYFPNMKKKKQDNQVVIYRTKSGAIELRGDFERDTAWITQKQMGVIFGVDVRTVNEHLKNIFKTKELDEKSVIRKFRITANDGKIYNTSHWMIKRSLAK